MKALLIAPPSIHMITTNVPEVIDEETGLYPPIGLLSVAAYAREHSGWEIAVLDAQAEKVSYHELPERIARERPDLVGIQCLTFTLIDTLAVARAVKKLDPGIQVCLGGPHVNIYPEETIAIPEVDALILGEGEISFTEFLKRLGSGGELREVPGLVCKRNGEVVRTGPPSLIENLDDLPLPARDLVPVGGYYSVLAKERPITTIISSRGCPYKCIFCDRPHLGKKFRARSAARVVAEMEACTRMGIRELVFYDDTFSIDRRRMEEICAEIERRGVRVGWDIRVRVNTVNRELLARLRRAGCRRIHYGIESGNPEVLKALRKGISLDQARNAFRWAAAEGITTLAYFMVGSPGEGRREIEDSIRFARELAPDFIHFSVTTPFPATELYELALERGLVKKDVWREFAADPRADFSPPLWEEHFDREELITILHRAYKSYYSRPGYLFRQVLKVRSPLELFRKARAGLRILRLKA